MLKHGLSICKWDTFQAKIFMSVDTFTGHLWLSGREWERPCRMIWSVRARPGPDTDGPRHTLQLNRLSTVLNKTFPLMKCIYQVCQRAPRQGRRRWRKAGKTAIRDSPPAFKVPCLLSWDHLPLSPGAAPASRCPAATWSPSPSSAASGPGRSWRGESSFSAVVSYQGLFYFGVWQSLGTFMQRYYLMKCMVWIFTSTPSWPGLLLGLQETPPPENME